MDTSVRTVRIYMGDNVYANVMACLQPSGIRVCAVDSAAAVLREYYDCDFKVIIRRMDSDFCEDVPEDYTRKVYTTYINAGTEKEWNTYRTYTTFRQFPDDAGKSWSVLSKASGLGLEQICFPARKLYRKSSDYERESQEISKRSALIDELTSGIAQEEDVVEDAGAEDEIQALITADINFRCL